MCSVRVSEMLVSYLMIRLPCSWSLIVYGGAPTNSAKSLSVRPPWAAAKNPTMSRRRPPSLRNSRSSPRARSRISVACSDGFRWVIGHVFSGCPTGTGVAGLLATMIRKPAGGRFGSMPAISGSPGLRWAASSSRPSITSTRCRPDSTAFTTASSSSFRRCSSR